MCAVAADIAARTSRGNLLFSIQFSGNLRAEKNHASRVKLVSRQSNNTQCLRTSSPCMGKRQRSESTTFDFFARELAWLLCKSSSSRVAGKLSISRVHLRAVAVFCVSLEILSFSSRSGLMWAKQHNKHTHTHTYFSELWDKSERPREREPGGNARWRGTACTTHSGISKSGTFARLCAARYFPFAWVFGLNSQPAISFSTCTHNWILLFADSTLPPQVSFACKSKRAHDGGEQKKKFPREESNQHSCTSIAAKSKTQREKE
jgi:hypothetical protein